MVLFNVWRTFHHLISVTLHRPLTCFLPHPCILFTAVNDISTWEHNDLKSKQTDKAFTTLPSSKIQEGLVCIGYKPFISVFVFVLWSACHVVPGGTIYNSKAVTCRTIELSRTISKMGLWNRIHCSLLSLLIRVHLLAE